MSVVLSIFLFNDNELLQIFFMYSIGTIQKLQFNCMYPCMCKSEYLSLCNV